MQQDHRAIVDLSSGVVDEARKRAARTLPGLVVGGVVGALLGGPEGAFLGAVVGINRSQLLLNLWVCSYHTYMPTTT